MSRVSGVIGNGVWEAFQMKQQLSWKSKVRVRDRIRSREAEVSWGKLYGLQAWAGLSVLRVSLVGLSEPGKDTLQSPFTV